MKKFLEEFKAFALKGNVMDMAVGVIIGGAFATIVNALTEDFINPILSLIPGNGEVGGAIKIKEGVYLNYGHFITAVINFLIMAFILFCMLKAINKAINIRKKPEAPSEPTTKECPYCKSEISLVATRCPFCTSMIEDDSITKA